MPDIKPDTFVRLGDIVFDGMEVPQRIPFGGEQSITAHDLVGGTRIVDAMGAVHADLSWSGIFQGPNALERAVKLDEMRIAGKAISLTWSELRYTVVIREFVADFERKFRMPYRIACMVVENQNTQAFLIGIKMAQQMTQDATAGVKSAERTRVQKVIDAAKKAREKIEGVGDFIRAAPAKIMEVRNAVGGVISATRDAITSAEDILSLGIPIDLSFGGNADTATETLALYETQYTAMRMEQNIDAFGQEGYEAVLGGGDIYRVAADVYGDPSEWVTIAASNPALGFDPTVQGVQSVVVPTLTLDSGGVLPGAE